MDGPDDPWVFRIQLDALSQLTDLLVEVSTVGEIVVTPALVGHQLSIHHLTNSAVQQAEDGQLP